MKMTFSTARGFFSIELELVVLFRDNVQHHLQRGLPGSEFSLIHALGDAALDGRSIRLPAVPLWEQGRLGWQGIEAVDVRDLAVSLRTTAAVVRTDKAPAVRGTMLLRCVGWLLPPVAADAGTLGELFADFYRKLQLVTSAAGPGDLVHVAPARGLAPHAAWLH